MWIDSIFRQWAALLLLVAVVANAQTSEDDLLRYSFRGDIVKVGTILNSGLDPNIWNKAGQTPLQLAAGEGHLDMVTLLLDHNASLTLSSDGGYTPLLIAAYNQHTDVVAELIREGADVGDRRGDGESALMFAARAGNLNLVDLLARAGANLNASDTSGETPLMAAAENGYMPVIDSLLNAGVDVNVRSSGGITAACFAERNGFAEIAEILHSEAGVWEECVLPNDIPVTESNDQEDRQSEPRREVYIGFVPATGIFGSSPKARYQDTRKGLEHGYRRETGTFEMPFYAGYAHGPWRVELGASSDNGLVEEMVLVREGLSSSYLENVEGDYLNPYGTTTTTLTANGHVDFWGRSLISPYIGGGIGVRKRGIHMGRENGIDIEEFEHLLFSLSSPLYWQFFAGARMTLYDPDYGPAPRFRVKLGVSYGKEDEYRAGSETLRYGSQWKTVIGLELFTRRSKK